MPWLILKQGSRIGRLGSRVWGRVFLVPAGLLPVLPVGTPCGEVCVLWRWSLRTYQPTISNPGQGIECVGFWVQRKTLLNGYRPRAVCHSPEWKPTMATRDVASSLALAVTKQWHAAKRLRVSVLKEQPLATRLMASTINTCTVHDVRTLM